MILTFTFKDSFISTIRISTLRWLWSKSSKLYICIMKIYYYIFNIFLKLFWCILLLLQPMFIRKSVTINYYIKTADSFFPRRIYFEIYYFNILFQYIFIFLWFSSLDRVGVNIYHRISSLHTNTNFIMFNTIYFVTLLGKSFVVRNITSNIESC